MFDTIREPPRPFYVVWETTLRCDLACHHCGSRAGRAREGELTTAEALDLVSQLADLGATELTLIGGEAYLREDWTTLVRAVRDRGIACTITTGGRGFTPERARAAADAGLQSVSVSLDGVGPTHDLQRGVSGSYGSALEALENLREAGVAVSANTQLNRLTVPELDAVLDVIADHGCFAWQTQLTVAMGRAVEQPSWLLQPWELLALFPKLAELTERGRSLGVQHWPGNNLGYFGPYEAPLRGSVREGAHAHGCAAGAHVLGIEADGTVKGCPSLPTDSYAGGSVRERPLRALWEESLALRFTRDRTAGELWGYCAECYYADLCRAGCTWTAHSLFGRRGNNPYCHHRALELDRLGLRERLVPVRPAPGLPFDHGLFELVLEPRDAPAPALPPPSAPARRLTVL